ncbi:hypothetical protein ST47_g4217 [Ascochyta rabiei]|uniref:Hydrolase n=1 Tax=Didymella rabiei TaxID=5454 RepID=A0A163FTX0_DIDRA|nr:hypothetical protein ST47_g4217 [Ascochyta rabiei]
MHGLTSILAFLLLAFITQANFTGIGNIYVLKSENWGTASPTKDKIGCLNDSGKLVATTDEAACGIFTRLNDFPYTLSTKKGNCTFTDESQERNTDSMYGGSDHAWNCNATILSDIYDGLYTIDGFPYVFLCFGDVACYYDAKKAPERNEKLSVWQYHWGSQQLGITPGHIQLVLMWNKTGGSPKRAKVADIPSPRVRLTDGLQIPLLGQQRRLG